MALCELHVRRVVHHAGPCATVEIQRKDARRLQSLVGREEHALSAWQEPRESMLRFATAVEPAQLLWLTASRVHPPEFRASREHDGVVCAPRSRGQYLCLGWQWAQRRR